MYSLAVTRYTYSYMYYIRIANKAIDSVANLAA